jgi:3-(3-hydroxy-phenyl)propionate hydroxylase
MPDLDVVTAAGPQRVFALLHEAKALLLDFGTTGSSGIAAAWSSRVRSVEAQCPEAWEIPAVGQVPAPGAVLIRPDGHVAWVAHDGPQGLAEALTTWCGPASSRGTTAG